MKLYVDGSALVKLLIREDESAEASSLWDQADRVVSAATIAIEGRAAIARRLHGRRATRARKDLARRLGEVALARLDDDLLEDAGRIADRFRLRTLDAIHLAAARQIEDDNLVFATWDRELATAASAAGLTVFP